MPLATHRYRTDGSISVRSPSIRRIALAALLMMTASTRRVHVSTYSLAMYAGGLALVGAGCTRDSDILRALAKGAMRARSTFNDRYVVQY
jgi:hypothetical protein